MKGNGLAFGALALVVALIVGAGFYTDFWREVAPFILHRGGPGGLDNQFAASLVSGGVGTLAQVFFTFFLVTVLLGRQARLTRSRNRAIVARQLCDIFEKSARKLANLNIQPNRGTERYDAKDQLFGMLSAQFNGETLTPEEQSEIFSLNELYDQVVFDKKIDIVPQFRTDLIDVLKKMVRQTIVTRLWNLLRGKERPRQILFRNVDVALASLIEKRQQPVLAQAA